MKPKHGSTVAWNFKPRKGRTAEEMIEWNALDAEERRLRRHGHSYLIDCRLYMRGAAVLCVTKDGNALAVGLKGYTIIPNERYAEFTFATTAELFRALIKRLLNLCKRT